MDKDVFILAIESSCDETAAAVVKNGREVLSNVIYTQIALHELSIARIKTSSCSACPISILISIL